MKPGTVLPLLVVCGLPFIPARAMEERTWTRVWGSATNDEALAVAVDAAANAYVAGYVLGPVHGQTPPGVKSACLSSYDPAGARNWTVVWGPTNSHAEARGVTVGRDGNIYVAGLTWGPFDGQPAVGNGDFFLSKFKPGGEREWTRIWGSGSVDQGCGVAVDPGTNIYVTGSARGSVYGQPFVNRDDFCLSKFNAQGAHQWTRMWGGVNGATGYEGGQAVAVDAAGNAYVSGFSDTSLDGQPFAGTFDIVLAKYSADGTKQWLRMWGASGVERGHGVAVDAQGQVYVSGLGGSFNGETSAGSTDPFLLKVDASGTLQWTRLWGSIGDDFGFGVDVDDQGLLYVTGLAAYGKTFDGQPPYAGGAFLTCFSGAGARQWTKRWGAGDTEGRGVACLGTNVAYVAGPTYGAFDGETPGGLYDLWVSRWGPVGPPRITGGPSAVNLAATSATIQWTTSRAADSAVDFSPYGSSWDGRATNGAFTLNHALDLSNLLPGLTYRYRARSADAEGRAVTSSVRYFTTTAGGGAYVHHDILAAGVRPPQAVADTTGEVDRVELTVNGQLVGACYGGDAAWNLDDDYAPLVLGENAIVATAYRPDNSVCGMSAGSWLRGNTGMPSRVEIEQPWSGYVFHTDGVTAPATSVLFRVLAAEWRSHFVRGLDGLGPYGSDSDEIHFDWASVTNVRFYVDGALVHTSPAPVPNPYGTALHHEFLYDITGLSTGAYRLRATFTPAPGWRQSWDYATFRIERKSEDLIAWRETAFNTSSNCIVVDLKIRNRGSGAATVGRIEEPMLGFQAGRITTPWPGAGVDTTYDWGTRTCTLVVTCDPRETIGAGETVTLRYHAVPVLYPGGGDYELGGGGSLEGGDTLGWAITEDLRSVVTTVGPWDGRVPLADAVATCKRRSDYLMITCPPPLSDAFGTSGSNDILEKMAELATHRNAVLGFYHAANWTRTAFRSGDPLALGYTFKEWEESDQLWVADEGDNRMRAYARAYQVVDGDIPIPFAADIRPGDAMAVGNLIGSDLTGTNEHPRQEIALALGDGHGVSAGGVQVYSYRYDPTTNLFASFTMVVSDYATGGALLAGRFEDLDGDEEFAVVAPDGEINFYRCSGLSAGWFGGCATAYRAGDLVTAGNVVGDDFDEVVIGDVDANRIRLVGKETEDDDDRPPYIEHSSFAATIDEGDDLATANVQGDDRKEILLADASEDRIRIYEVHADRSIHFVDSFDWPFDPGDRLAGGRVGSLVRDQIVVARGSEHHGVEAGVVEMFRPVEGQPPGDRHALDDLIDEGGEWAAQLAEGWVSDGHLLLVGETEIVPAFRSTFRVYMDAAYHNWPADFTDREYADTDADAQKPELAAGRIVGDSADALIQALQTSIDLANGDAELDVGSALAVSGNTDGDDKFMPVRNRIRDALNARGFTTTTMANEGATNVFAAAANRDVIFFSGHGNYNAWDGLDTGDLDDLYAGGNGHPVVYYHSCLTGRYPAGYSFVEAFLLHGASVCVGATEVTYGYDGSGGIGWAPRMADAFFDRLQADYTIGQTLKHAKRYRMSRAANTYCWDWAVNRYHCAVYHLYGDPRVAFDWGGAAPAPTPAASAAADVPPVQGPVPTLAMPVPMFQVTAVGNRHYIRLEGGEDVARDGWPLVPLFTRTVAFPAGCCVQDVALRERSAPLVYSNLQPVVCRVGLNGTVRTAGGLDEAQGPWPDRVFDWSLERQPDGGSILYVTAYPFHHDTESGISEYATNFLFDIAYRESPVLVTRVRTDRHEYTNGQSFVAHVYLHATNAQPADVALHPRIVSLTDGTEIPLPLRLLRGLQGWASCRLAWTVAVTDPGDYRLEVAAVDGQEAVLDRGGADFVVGVAGARLRNFFLSPSPFGLNEPVTLGVTLDNTGTLPLDGSVYILLQDAAGRTIAQFRHDFVALPPGQSSGFQDGWSASLLTRNCRVIVYAVYEGATTGLQLMADGSGEPLVLDAFGMAQGGGALRWASRAGRYYSVEATPDLSQPFERVRSNVGATPPFNELNDLPPVPQVFYRIVEHDAPEP